MSATPAVQGRCPACSRSTLILGAGGHVTCSHLDCPAPTAADEVLHRQTIGQWPGSRCEITIDVLTEGCKQQIRRVTPLLPDDMGTVRALLAAELRQVANEIDELGLDTTGGKR